MTPFFMSNIIKLDSRLPHGPLLNIPFSHNFGKIFNKDRDKIQLNYMHDAAVFLLYVNTTYLNLNIDLITSNNKQIF